MAKKKSATPSGKLSLTQPQGKPALVETEVTPETPFQQVDVSDYERRARQFAASCAREKDRIAHENGVRLGDSMLNEAKAVQVIDAAMDELIAYYTSMFQIP